jgi:hypothetical protein
MTNKLPRVLLFNGPPRSGKDASATIVADWLRNHDLTPALDKFSRPIKCAFAGLFDPSLSMERDSFGELLTYADDKERLIPLLGVSYRQWQIEFSERFMKPRYGQTVFARLLAEEIMSCRADASGNPLYWLIPDSGFQTEANYLLEVLPPENIMIFRLEREGTSFAGDSRSYIISPHPDLYCYLIKNHGSLEDLKCELDTAMLLCLRRWRNLGSPKAAEAPSSKPSPVSPLATSSPDAPTGLSSPSSDSASPSETPSPLGPFSRSSQ